VAPVHGLFVFVAPGSAGQPLVVIETPASPDDDVVSATPAPVLGHSSVPGDPVLNRMISVNAEGLRKRRLNLGLSPDIQVPSPKHRLLSAKLNISRLFNKLVYSLICIARSTGVCAYTSLFLCR
jgi:hypothetical protein